MSLNGHSNVIVLSVIVAQALRVLISHNYHSPIYVTCVLNSKLLTIKEAKRDFNIGNMLLLW